jgi:hypothetical protein
MKCFHLKSQKELKPPFAREVTEMLAIEKEHSINLPFNGIGYIIGDRVLAPFFFKENMTAQKDGHNIVLTYENTSVWGVSYFRLPFPIVCEPLHFRHEHLHKDTFFFKVSDDVQFCKGLNISSTKGKFEVGIPADFCPVFDRHAHLVGMNVGLLHNTWLTIKIEELL